MTNNFSAVIFDMDGLVLDTESTYCPAWQQAAATMGQNLPDAFCLSLSGLHQRDVEQKLLAACGADFNLQDFHHTAGLFWRDHVNTHGITIKPGFTPLLDNIVQQQLPFCLATNSRAANAFECLELAGLSGVFATVITRDDVECGKPAPDIFLAAADALQVDIRHCLVLEDSYTGIVAATTAGAFSVYVPSVTPADPAAIALCGMMAADLRQILDIIRLA
ncbi:MAG: HAD family phosphatase [Methylovulum sp.]|nr:HAD family phosphatase [Methylovulum sp.]